jgi:pimeloyl-ACP methyl ester carboxylesterase
MGEAAARWIKEADLAGPLVVMGHSTGAQVALGAALRLQHDRPDLSLVLAGLTFRPEHRSWSGLLRGAATAYRKDSPAELVVAKNIVAVRTDVLRLVESGRRDRPEERVGDLDVPLVLTAGEADSFAPQRWMADVAAAAGSPSARVEVLPGSHNNLFTHAEEVADVVSAAAPATAP